MAKSLSILIVSLLMITIGCQKQSPDQIEPDYIDSISEVRRGEACSQTDLTKNLLEKSNLINFYICATWDEKFPIMFESLKEVDAKAWAHFTNPLNELILNDRKTRDNLVGLMKELDKKGGLDDLGEVILSLSDTNFYSNLNKVLNCIEPSVDCPGNSAFNEDDFNNFIDILRLDKKDLSNLIAIAESVVVNLNLNGDSFISSLSEELSKTQFDTSRLLVIDEFMNKVDRGDFSVDLEFYKNVVSHKDDHSQTWLRSFLSHDLTSGDLNYLLQYPVKVNPSQWKDFRVVRKILGTDLICEPDIGYDGMRIDFTEHLNTFLDDLFSSTQDEFFRKSIQTIGVIKIAGEICNDLKTHEGRVFVPGSSSEQVHKVDFVNLVTKNSRLLLHKGYYKLFHFLQNAHPRGRDNKTFLLRYLSDDFYVRLIQFAEVLSPSTIKALYPLLENLDENFYSKLFVMLEWIEELGTDRLQAIGHFWHAFDDKGKMFFINFFDRHYESEANVNLLLRYYLETVSLIESDVIEILKRYFPDDKNSQIKENLMKITDSLSRKGILPEFKEFFSREHLLELLSIISRGHINADSTFLSNVYVRNSSRGPLPSLNVNDISSASATCLNRIADSQKSFYDLINYPPLHCRDFKSSDPMIAMLFGLGDLANELRSERGVGLSEDGLLSAPMLRAHTVVFKNISEKYAVDKEDGLSYVSRSVSEFLEKEENKAELSNILNIFDLITFEDSRADLIDTISEFYSNDNNFNYLSFYVDLITNSFDAVATYLDDRSADLSFKEIESFKCDNFHNENGGVPCPSISQIKEVASRLIYRLTKKNPNVPSALDQLIKLLSIDHGINIPYEASEQRLKRVTFAESIMMFSKFTDKEISKNSIDVEYKQIPKSDERFFNGVDWSIDGDDLDGSPEKKVLSLNTLERIEVVIRDIRFDENYLGAHYLNAVAKAVDYNSVVESKHSLLKACVPFRFCGKFMNSAQHDFSKNSRDTFLSLLDVNTFDDWSHGDYMQALITSLVSSSPVESQVSSVVNKRVLGINVKIPWLLQKETLEDHKGKVLGLVSMVGAFTNGARVIKDRIGEKEEVVTFVSSKRLNKVDNNLLRNYKSEIHLMDVEEFLSMIDKNGLLDDVVEYFHGLNYQKQRIIENIIGNSLYLASFIGNRNDFNSSLLKDRYANNSIFDLLSLLTEVTKNYEFLSKLLPLKSEDFLQKTNKFIGFISSELDKESSFAKIFIKGLNELIYFYKNNSLKLNENIATIIEDEANIGVIKNIVSSFESLTYKLKERSELQKLSEFLNFFVNNQSHNFNVYKDYLHLNAAKKLCWGEVERSCRVNPSKGEISDVLNYLFKDKSRNFFEVFDFFGRENNENSNDFFLNVFPSIRLNQ